MIRHIVLVKFRSGLPAGEIAAVFAALDDLRAATPGMSRFDAGADVSPEGLARGFTHAFTVDFANVAARDAYLVHPAHQAAGARLVGAAEGGIDGLLVIDIAIGG
ncbi:MAG: Dabb family protein [Roseiarcus sp.]|jgi:hypothetical protein